MERGIAVAGTTLVDVVKMIDAWPEKGMLVGIGEVSRAPGGIVPNVGIDLAVMDPALPVYGYGAVGDDENAAFLRAQLTRYGINADGLVTVPGEVTGFTDVMTIRSTGERTFFTKDGAGAVFAPDDAFLDGLRADILHIGYILLMKGLDEEDPDYGTRLARLLARAEERGIRTSIDVVSRANFREKVVPALRQCSYAIMNEIEGCGALGITARDENGRLIPENVKKAMAGMLDLGVKEAVVIHCPEAGFLCRRGGDVTVLPSLMLPDGYIKGSVGAGDAFCAACLLGFYRGWEDERILAFASAAAAANLAAPDATGGMRPLSKIEELGRRYPRRPMP